MKRGVRRCRWHRRGRGRGRRGGRRRSNGIGVIGNDTGLQRARTTVGGEEHALQNAVRIT